MKSVSLVIPTYNGERYLPNFLLSIYFQSRKPDQVIFQDDGSSDNTVQIIRAFIDEHKLNWILKVNNLNKGWRLNFESLISEADGDVIFLADQDDLWKPNKIEQMVTIFEKVKEVQVLTSNYDTDISDTGKKVPIDSILLSSKEPIKKVRQVKSIPNNYYIKRPGWTFAISRNIIPQYLEAQNQCPTKAHDALLWQLALMRGTLFHFSAITGTWVMHSTSAMATEKAHVKLTERTEILSSYARDEIILGEYYLKIISQDSRKLTDFLKRRLVNLKKRRKVWEQLSFIFLIKSCPSYLKARDFLADFRIVFLSKF